MHTAEKIKSIVSIEQVLSVMYGLEVKKRMPCPIHGGTKYNFSVRGDFFKCFSCGESGDIFTFVMKMSGCTFAEAKKAISGYFGLEHTNTSESERKLFLRRLRAIKAENEQQARLKKIRNYQQAQICEALRSLRTLSGDSFPEKHLEQLLSRFETKTDFYIKHDINQQLRLLYNNYRRPQK